MFLKRDPESRKGENGRVLVVGGSKDYVGAPALAALAALRTGTDLVTVAAPEKVAWTINTYSPDLITKKFKGDFFTYEDAEEILKLTEKADVLLIGNGLGQEPSTFDFIKEVVKHCPIPKVIDADAIKALRGEDIRNAIITPHKKEFEILTDSLLSKDLESKAKAAREFAKKDRIILLKGKTDIITDREIIKFNNTGNEGMTIGGTGDVLAGITAGLLAQTKDLLGSAVNAAYINGLIGDYLLKKKGYGFTASDMIELIPEIKNKQKWIK